jgi:hypothetical protein
MKTRNACGYAVQCVYLTVSYFQDGSRVKYTKVHVSYFSVSPWWQQSFLLSKMWHSLSHWNFSAFQKCLFPSMEGTGSSDISVNIYETTRCHMVEDNHFQIKFYVRLCCDDCDPRYEKLDWVSHITLLACMFFWAWGLTSEICSPSALNVNFPPKWFW